MEKSPLKKIRILLARFTSGLDQRLSLILLCAMAGVTVAMASAASPKVKAVEATRCDMFLSPWTG